MLNINKLGLGFNNKNLPKGNTHTSLCKAIENSTWCQHIQLNSDLELSYHYLKICRDYQQQNKWILMLDPEQQALTELSAYHELTKSILRINTNKVTIKLAHIEQALITGNCSVIVLSDTCFNEIQLNYLTRLAEQGKTQLIVLKQRMKMH